VFLDLDRTTIVSNEIGVFKGDISIDFGSGNVFVYFSFIKSFHLFFLKKHQLKQSDVFINQKSVSEFSNLFIGTTNDGLDIFVIGQKKMNAEIFRRDILFASFESANTLNNHNILINSEETYKAAKTSFNMRTIRIHLQQQQIQDLSHHMQRSGVFFVFVRYGKKESENVLEEIMTKFDKQKIVTGIVDLGINFFNDQSTVLWKYSNLKILYWNRN